MLNGYYTLQFTQPATREIVASHVSPPMYREKEVEMEIDLKIHVKRPINTVYLVEKLQKFLDQEGFQLQ